jgi:hypothetical protein
MSTFQELLTRKKKAEQSVTLWDAVLQYLRLLGDDPHSPTSMGSGLSARDIPLPQLDIDVVIEAMQEVELLSSQKRAAAAQVESMTFTPPGAPAKKRKKK